MVPAGWFAVSVPVVGLATVIVRLRPTKGCPSTVAVVKVACPLVAAELVVVPEIRT